MTTPDGRNHTAPPRPRHTPPRFDAIAAAIDRTIEALTELRDALPRPTQQSSRPPQRTPPATPQPAAPAPRTTVSAPATTAPPAPPAIDVRGLTKRFGEQRAVDDLTFQVPRGSITGFVGPNGSGKTTTIRMLLHLARPDAGTARILGAPLDHPRAYLPKVGALIESPAFDPGLSGIRNLQVQATLAGFPAARIGPTLRLVGLGDAGSKPYAHYSLGMKQRLGIAAALRGDPQLLILDEPTNGLDPAGIREIRTLLARIRATGRTIFVSSHLLGEMERVCDHLVVIRSGRLVYQGSVAAIGAGGLEDKILDMMET